MTKLLEDMKNEATASGLYVLGKDFLPILSKTTANAFCGDPIFSHMSKSANDDQVWDLALVTFKTIFKDSLILSTDVHGTDYIVVCDGSFRGIDTMPFLMNGGLKTVGNYGLGGALRMIKYEDYAMGLRKKYTGFNDLYIYQLAVREGSRKQGRGTRLLRFVTDYGKKHGLPVYLETHKITNVWFYEKRGFRLLHREEVPGSDNVIHNAMVCD